MSDTMPIEEYLAEGGVLTSPDNAPPRYRAELLRLMASFVDSELAGSAGFADIINDAPGISERIAAARIVMEKADHAREVLKVMGTFGADTARYAVHHSWSDRLPRDADIGAERRGGDMRLSVLHYPLQGWTDAVAMNVLMGKAVVIQLKELAQVSYQPLAEIFRTILSREAQHAELGVEGLKRIIGTEEGRRAAREAIAYWRPRVAVSFGRSGSSRYDMLARLGLRHTPNEALLLEWQAAIDAELLALNLN